MQNDYADWLHPEFFAQEGGCDDDHRSVMSSTELILCLRAQLVLLQTIVDAELLRPQGYARPRHLRNWQNQRLEKSFSNLPVQQHCAAVDFFISDLYDNADLGWRDRDVQRILPILIRWLPTSVLMALADVLELDLIFRQFDLAMAHVLPLGTITVQNYAEAYRQVSDVIKCSRQIALIGMVGQTLEGIVRKSWILGC